jgi:predicted flap endonuclease-1-like 5' DNA nuclease
MANLTDIEGIGTVYGEKLAAAGLKTTDDLLARGGTRDGREGIAAETGLTHDQILEWVNHADLYRIDGVGSEYADLLEAAGVDSVVELAQRKPDNLVEALMRANEERQLVRSLPNEAAVTRWVEQAKGLDRAVSH